MIFPNHLNLDRKYLMLTFQSNYDFVMGQIKLLLYFLETFCGQEPFDDNLR